MAYSRRIKQGNDGTYDIRPEDEGVTAGDARGENSVDLQTVRSASTQVASGDESVVSGGERNTASGNHSGVGGGFLNRAQGNNSFCGGGNNAQADGTRSATIGGTGPQAHGNYSAVLSGFQNKHTGSSGVAMGSEASGDKNQTFVQGGGKFATKGDAQTTVLVLRNSTTDATQTEMFINADNTTRCTIASDTTWTFNIMVTARRTDADNESAGYRFFGVMDNNAGTTALVGSVTKEVAAEDTTAWDVTVEADDTNDALVIKVTGEASKTIQWVARIELVETTG